MVGGVGWGGISSSSLLKDLQVNFSSDLKPNLVTMTAASSFFKRSEILCDDAAADLFPVAARAELRHSGICLLPDVKRMQITEDM